MAMVFSGQYDDYDQPIMVESGTGFGDEPTPTPLPDYSNEGRNYPTSGDTQGPGGSPVNSSIDNSGSFFSGITKYLNDKLGTSMSNADLIKYLAIGGGGVAGLMGANKPSVIKVGYQGGIPQLQANRNMMTAPPAGRRPGSGGVNYGGDVVYSPQGTPANAPGGSYTPSAGNMVSRGGLAGLLASARQQPNSGAGMSQPGYSSDMIMPEHAMRDVDYPEANMRPVSGSAASYGYDPTKPEDSFNAKNHFAHGGSTGRYLQGSTDGMADKLRTSIDGKQPAALSHGEFVIPADVVSHLGNGNSDAGAKKLYSMMDKIREARTGTKKQGKQINPDKFMPGGLAAAYAAGGDVRHFATGDAVGSAAAAGVTGTEQGLSNYVGPYVTNMLAKGEALSNAPYQQYQGPLTAGASDLQNQAFNTASNLQVPGSVGAAANTAGDIANKAANINYTPTGFTNQFNAPDAGTATNFTNQYQAPTPYQNTNFTSGTFGSEQAQQYMNPYLQQSLNPQLEEARRQAQINQQLSNANAIKSGGFGGGAGDIMARASQRDLNSNLANITGQGYNTAYTNAMSQFNADQARNMQAQQASEQSKQFGATQGMTAAQMMAQYGMSAQQAQEAARQFQQNQAMTGAQNAAQYGQAANTAAEQSKQFGANLGLQGLNTGLQAAQTQGNLGISSGQLGLQQLQEQAQLGNTQRGIESEGIAADKKAFEEARDNPYKMAQFQQSLLNGLPITATNYQMNQPGAFQSAVGGATSAADLYKKLKDLGIV